jgi:hypothetical protein
MMSSVLTRRQLVHLLCLLRRALLLVLRHILPLGTLIHARQLRMHTTVPTHANRSIARCGLW